MAIGDEDARSRPSGCTVEGEVDDCKYALYDPGYGRSDDGCLSPSLPRCGEAEDEESVCYGVEGQSRRGECDAPRWIWDGYPTAGVPSLGEGGYVVEGGSWCEEGAYEGQGGHSAGAACPYCSWGPPVLEVDQEGRIAFPLSSIVIALGGGVWHDYNRSIDESIVIS